MLQVVQSKVGYTPKEVNRALDGKNPQEVREMKAVMKRFQLFLRKFEVEIVSNPASTAIEFLLVHWLDSASCCELRS